MRSVLALTLLVGVAGGVTLAAVAGARRTDTAFSRLVTATNAWEVLVNPDLGSQSELRSGRIRRLPLLVVNAVAFVPSRIAARLRPATVLRSE